MASAREWETFHNQSGEWLVVISNDVPVFVTRCAVSNKTESI